MKIYLFYINLILFLRKENRGIFGRMIEN
jgi:hypothetical protein